MSTDRIKPEKTSEEYRKRFRSGAFFVVFILMFTLLFISPDRPQATGMNFFIIAAGLFFMAHARMMINIKLKAEEEPSVHTEPEPVQYVDRNFKIERSQKTIEELAQEYQKEHSVDNDEIEKKDPEQTKADQ